MKNFLFTNSEYEPKHRKAIYNRFLEFKDVFLDKGYSIFDRNLQLFDNEEVFNEYETRIIKNYDTSKLDNKTKYKLQLDGANKKVRHFFANLIYLYLLPIYDVKKETKAEEISGYLKDQVLPTDFFLDNGFASYGAMKKFKYYDMNFIYFFVKEYVKTKDNPIGIINHINLFESLSLISDESFKNMKSLASKHMMKFLFQPDYYEPIVNATAKREIVKHFLGEYSESTLDDDIYKIRDETFGFDESIYFHVYSLQDNKSFKKVKLKFPTFKSASKPHELSFVSVEDDSDEDVLSRDIKALENGLEAEEIVYKDILENLVPAKRSMLIELMKDEFPERSFDAISQKLDDLIYYSKNINRYAPFDLIDYRNNDFLFVEVKSTTSNKIFFSRAEIIFAYENARRYQIKVVKDNEIFIVELGNEIEDIYTIMKSNDCWSFKTVVFIVSFD